ncbi:MAG: helix-turn-helix transcriptional regulator [Cupriavidus sp.]|nr:helix-turn-helix transcriptional regulator [Cupriavidus sp.]
MHDIAAYPSPPIGGLNPCAVVRNMKLDRAFGRAVKDRRLDAGLTQAAFAELLGMQSSAIGRLERGIVSPSLDMVDRVATALGVTPSLLLQEAEAHLQRVTTSPTVPQRRKADGHNRQ